MVASIVTKTAVCLFNYSLVLKAIKTGVNISPTIQKATADANPKHSGICFSPASDPFLLMSSP